MNYLRSNLDKIVGKLYAGLTVERVDECSYQDPVDNSLSEHQGLRVWFEGGARVVLRLSGTGTEGATIRLYLEQYEKEADSLQLNTAEVLNPLLLAILELTRLEELTGKSAPDVVT